MITAKIIADSTCNGHRITSFVLEYPRFIHAELMTHRVFSRNASSSRAIPFKTALKRIAANPAMPVHWGKNQPGMQAKDEEVDDIFKAEQTWLDGLKLMIDIAQNLSDQSVHKQVVNRLLEPWAHIQVLVTATDYENFFALRCHKDAQPEIQALANKMKAEYVNHTPNMIAPGTWHIPFITEKELMTHPINELLMISTARCARVSYGLNERKEVPLNKEIELYNKLITQIPIHASPCEHQARAIGKSAQSKNFLGWQQYRQFIESNITIDY